GRPRRRQDGGAPRRQQQPRPAFQRRNHFSSGQYSSIYAGPFPTDDFEGGMNLADLQAKDVEELREMAAEHGVEGYDELEHSDLVLKLLDIVPLAPSHARRELTNGRPGTATGILEIVDEGFGFLRRHGVMPSNDDIYVSSSQVRRFGLRTGDKVEGQTRPPKDQEKYWGLLRVDTVNGVDPETAKRRPYFDTLVPVFPDEMFDIETDQKNLTQRLINLISPIGKGQRGLILSPAKAGKTTVLKHIAAGISDQYPEALLMVALIGERPEEVTDMSRSVKGEIYASTFDEPTENHTRVAEMALEIAKRQVETGRDVVILLDSITRLARAYNLALPASGKTLSGGVDPVALYPPKRFFGAARNVEGGGSLTIIATCLVDTGSRMDDVIYEEFKGTGNMELALDRKLSEKRIFPAIDVLRSGTRREELLLDENSLRMVWTMRRMLSAVGPNEGIELLMQRLGKTKDNAEFLVSLSKSVEASER
ncbi:MAG TPA: transcription termination factor Rho, partial [Candidatus Limnocylindrales bacterium]|nr:transcription termination factor Rho [Candidatus Limnocylindrales bacterium]